MKFLFRNLFLVTFTLPFCLSANAQNTVGLITLEKDKISPGLNLIFPSNQSDVYLLNECGQIVHSWSDERSVVPGNAAYLLDNGNLAVCKRRSSSAIFDPIWAGGAGETVEIRSWENKILHSYTLNDSLFRLHHDVAPMTNGNILLLVWEVKSRNEAIEAGRNPSLLDNDVLWGEAIFEWNPFLDSIVWEWHVWDHLIQDFDRDQLSYGSPAMHPRLIDLNYPQAGHPDWLHINAIDYNPVLDQIMLSVAHFNEIWIIDHGTTSEEAKGHSGGKAGSGGDLLFRWGNPAAFGQGGQSDQMLFFQHDAHWVNPSSSFGEEDFGKIVLFNNRLPSGISSIDWLVASPDSITFNYSSPGIQSSDLGGRLVHPQRIQMASSNSLSSAQLLPNGNALALSGRWGFAYELAPTGEVVWEYVIPLRAGQPVRQGDTLQINSNSTFRMRRYSLDYPAFHDKNLVLGDYLELDPDVSFCDRQLTGVNSLSTHEVSLYPNPAHDWIYFNTTYPGDIEFVEVYHKDGRRINQFEVRQPGDAIDLRDLRPGMYFLKMSHVRGLFKIIKY